MEYLERSYRELHRQDDLVHFQVAVKETDLDIGVRKERFSPELVRWVEDIIRTSRQPLEEYLKRDPQFIKALTPHPLLPDAPAIVQEMAQAAELAGVGPMAAVAGTMAAWVGKALAKRTRDLIVENGGDIYIRTNRVRTVGIFAGKSPLSNRIALEIRPNQSPLGICTSSGRVGPSLSLGKADAVVILSPSAALADAAATAAGNLVQAKEDIEKAVNLASGIPGVTGAVVIMNDQLAVWGQVKLCPM
ncbi:MAG: UPF0280 family protein [Desulfitobacteriaceae bacterium]|nr:UPF0280 family protein [Desulfitobacteriaceae bacterium]MDD4345564.1 UPF0280 family protein [Desulfitobacteriaceae bacterium]MDD4401228.1 UPF0280 family protein [Desulfitobacteriaceae bacterium]